MSTPNPYQHPPQDPYITDAGQSEPAGDAVPQGRRHRPWLPGLPKSALGRAIAFIVVGSVAAVALMFVSVEFFGREGGFRDEEERLELFTRARCVEYVEAFSNDDLGDTRFFGGGAQAAPVVFTAGDHRRIGHILMIGGRIVQDPARDQAEKVAGTAAMHRVRHLVEAAALLKEPNPFLESLTLDLRDPQYVIEADEGSVDGCRDSWLWRYTIHYEVNSPGYDRFTYEDAIEAGVTE